jgi:hypothetical protein
MRFVLQIPNSFASSFYLCGLDRATALHLISFIFKKYNILGSDVVLFGVCLVGSSFL